MLTTLGAAEKAEEPLLFLTGFFPPNSIKNRIKFKKKIVASPNKPNDVQVMLSCNINRFVIGN